MKVKVTEKYRDFAVEVKDPRFKKRSATIIMALEEDKKWHHGETHLELESFDGEVCYNLADMAFIGVVAEKVVELKEKLNKESKPVEVSKKVVHYFNMAVLGVTQAECGEIIAPSEATSTAKEVTCPHCLRVMIERGLL